jgi:hypothetical protein
MEKNFVKKCNFRRNLQLLQIFLFFI